MKNLIALFAIVFALFSCATEEQPLQSPADSPFPVSGNSTAQNNEAAGTSWRLALLVEDGKDLTPNFEGVSFFFEEAGNLVARGASGELRGNWQLLRRSSGDKLDIRFTGSLLFSELNEDWRIVEQSKQRIVLEDRDNGQVDRLVFLPAGSQEQVASPLSNAMALNFFSFLRIGALRVGEFRDGNTDRTVLFQGGELRFSDLGQVQFLASGQSTQNGQWKVEFSNARVILEMEFPNQNPVRLLDEDWVLVELNEQRARFQEEDGSDRLVLVR
ncbi:hypothetical protein A3SI_18146 [Nitritalea halalkaliphila LW7]|uniref:Lipocalin-like domain-containing protein n=1 Tax=Nitritalea halalkaliphila LW7 TaxID=1189621 RepID=I5BUV8_9BACT|nr:hypothetical protein [Nitritalea halalkaliphila]EIM73360.1 hypothetical protein A3SI_18146 [Nitritalea halalkaliphila LW7]